MRVALMRPINDAIRSAEALRARGFEPVTAPVMEIVATGALPPDDEFDALVATSANAVNLLSREARRGLTGLKLYVAGERAGAASSAAGLGEAEEIAPDSQALAASLAARLPPASRLLYLTGRDRKSDLESALSAAGHRVVAMEVYRAEARSAWSADEAVALSKCGAALHYSRRSAQLSGMLAERAGLGGHWRAILHVCISNDAGEPLRLFGARRIVAARDARESLLFDALELAART